MITSKRKREIIEEDFELIKPFNLLSSIDNKRLQYHFYRHKIERNLFLMTNYKRNSYWISLLSSQYKDNIALLYSNFVNYGVIFNAYNEEELMNLIIMIKKKEY